jgi:hypothetical protein
VRLASAGWLASLRGLAVLLTRFVLLLLLVLCCCLLLSCSYWC